MAKNFSTHKQNVTSTFYTANYPSQSTQSSTNQMGSFTGLSRSIYHKFRRRFSPQNKILEIVKIKGFIGLRFQNGKTRKRSKNIINFKVLFQWTLHSIRIVIMINFFNSTSLAVTYLYSFLTSLSLSFKVIINIGKITQDQGHSFFLSPILLCSLKFLFLLSSICT